MVAEEARLTALSRKRQAQGFCSGLLIRHSGVIEADRYKGWSRGRSFAIALLLLAGFLVGFTAGDVTRRLESKTAIEQQK